MARPNKIGLDIPKWKPTTSLLRSLGQSQRDKYKAIRGNASNYAKKPAVRDFIFKKNGYKCVQCGSKQDLTIDHIVSVYAAANGAISLEILNSLENLQTLCLKCNSGKL